MGTKSSSLSAKVAKIVRVPNCTKAEEKLISIFGKQTVKLIAITHRTLQTVQMPSTEGCKI
jgi:hypothetical protein